MVDELASLFQKNQDLVAENHRLAAANHQLMGYLGDVFSELRVLDEETRMRSGGRGERMGDETYRRVERHVGSGSWDREEEEHARRQMEEYQEQLRRQEEEIAGEFDGPEFADMNFEINANGERRFWGME